MEQVENKRQVKISSLCLLQKIANIVIQSVFHLWNVLNAFVQCPAFTSLPLHTHRNTYTNNVMHYSIAFLRIVAGKNILYQSVSVNQKENLLILLVLFYQLIFLGSFTRLFTGPKPASLNQISKSILTFNLSFNISNVIAYFIHWVCFELQLILGVHKELRDRLKYKKYNLKKQWN